MRITKTRLRQIIKEEITGVVSEDSGGQGTADVPTAQTVLALRKFFTSPDVQGVSAGEASVIQQLVEGLWKLAGAGNIMQGPVASRLKLLADAITDEMAKLGAGKAEAEEVQVDPEEPATSDAAAHEVVQTEET